jgi:hypothetical protein
VPSLRADSATCPKWGGAPSLETVLVEVKSVDGDAGGEDLSSLLASLEGFSERKDDVLKAITGVIEFFRQGLAAVLRDSGETEVEISMGVDVQAEAGIIIGKASATSSLVVTLRCRPPQP